MATLPVPPGHPSSYPLSRPSLSIYEEVDLEPSTANGDTPPRRPTPPPESQVPQYRLSLAQFRPVTILEYPSPTILTPTSSSSSVSSKSLKNNNEQNVKKVENGSCWYKPCTYSRLTWVRILFFLGIPTLSISWAYSLVYYFILPRCSGFKAMSEILPKVQGHQRTDVEKAQQAQQDLEDQAKLKARMSRWGVWTAAFWLGWWLGWVILGAVVVFTGKLRKD
ncbi:hypothetical protein DFH27DRAFT_345661 [Peziza echinospora]|nr:hypothetical protein DFH27DRAFT_345661 [Peziza echinospora]